MSFNHLAVNEGFEPLQPLLYPLETVPVVEYIPFEDFTITPDQCFSIAGLSVHGRFINYTHVVRRVVAPDALSLTPSSNIPPAGTDKLLFYNFDVGQKFYCQAVYSTYLFLDSNYSIMTT